MDDLQVKQYIDSLSDDERKKFVGDFYNKMIEPENLEKLKQALTKSLFKR